MVVKILNIIMWPFKQFILFLLGGRRCFTCNSKLTKDEIYMCKWCQQFEADHE